MEECHARGDIRWVDKKGFCRRDTELRPRRQQGASQVRSRVRVQAETARRKSPRQDPAGHVEGAESPGRVAESAEEEQHGGRWG